MSALLYPYTMPTFLTEGQRWTWSLLKGVYFSLITSYIYSFNKDFLSTYSVPGTVLGLGDIMISGLDQC